MKRRNFLMTMVAGPAAGSVTKYDPGVGIAPPPVKPKVPEICPGEDGWILLIDDRNLSRWTRNVIELSVSTSHFHPTSCRLVVDFILWTNCGFEDQWSGLLSGGGVRHNILIKNSFDPVAIDNPCYRLGNATLTDHILSWGVDQTGRCEATFESSIVERYVEAF